MLILQTAPCSLYSPCLSPNILLKFIGCLRDWITVDLTLELLFKTPCSFILYSFIINIFTDTLLYKSYLYLFTCVCFADMLLLYRVQLSRVTYILTLQFSSSSLLLLLPRFLPFPLSGSPGMSGFGIL